MGADFVIMKEYKRSRETTYFYMVTQSWTDVIVSSLQNLWWGVAAFIPNLIGALIVLVIGLIVAALLGSVVEKVFDAIKLDAFLAKLGLGHYVERAGMHLRGARFLGRLVYWFLVTAFLLAVSDILKLFALSDFLRQVLFYIPNVAIAVLVMLAAVVVANFGKKLVMASVMSAKLHAAHFLGSLAWWAIVIFGFFTALSELNIAPSIINAIVTGFIAMLALAGGLAFGLGGREYAAHLVGKLKDHTEGRV